jgi:hypothetical protein
LPPASRFAAKFLGEAGKSSSYYAHFGRAEYNDMKRSPCVQLILLGSAMGLYGCDGVTQALQQQRYTSLDQCRHDWGDPADCTAKPSGGGVGYYYYYGPRYYWDSVSGRPIAVAADGSTRSLAGSHITSEGSTVGGVSEHAGSFARGGFGSSAHGFGGG